MIYLPNITIIGSKILKHDWHTWQIFAIGNIYHVIRMVYLSVNVAQVVWAILEPMISIYIYTGCDVATDGLYFTHRKH